MKKAAKIEHVCDDAPYCGAKMHCPTKAISYEPSLRKIIIDDEKCIGCAKCVRTCPRGAIEMIELANEA